MRTHSPAYAAHIRQPVTTLAVCWLIVKNNGDKVLGTNHDRTIPITQTRIGVELESPPQLDLIGNYIASAGITASSVDTSDDMSVDNMEVNGALQPEPNTFIDVSVADIKAGLYDGARVTVFMVNWADPDDYQDILTHGFFGQIDWDSEGRYKTEVRSLLQVLQQQIGRTCGETCDVEEFGDERCKFPIATVTYTGSVTAVTSLKEFASTIEYGTAVVPGSDAFIAGHIIWTSGLNTGFRGQIKESTSSPAGAFVMQEEFPNDIEVGDTFDVIEGCNRKAPRCKQLGNFVNFRGPGIFNPGMDEIMRAP